jgi:hypothetical protein
VVVVLLGNVEVAASIVVVVSGTVVVVSGAVVVVSDTVVVVSDTVVVVSGTVVVVSGTVVVVSGTVDVEVDVLVVVDVEVDVLVVVACSPPAQKETWLMVGACPPLFSGGCNPLLLVAAGTKVYVFVSTPPFTKTTLTAIVEVKSNVSSANGSGPATLVNVNVCPLTVNDALSPTLNPFNGLEFTEYSVVPCGQLRLSLAPAGAPRTIAVLPSSPTANTPSPSAIRARLLPIPKDTVGLPACRVAMTRLHHSIRTLGQYHPSWQAKPCS